MLTITSTLQLRKALSTLLITFLCLPASAFTEFDNDPPPPAIVIKHLGPGGDFQTDPDHPENDFLQFQLAAKFINDRQGYTDLIIDDPGRPNRTYIVGNETFGNDSLPYYRSQYPFYLHNCQNVTVRGGGLKPPILKTRDKMHLGYFGLFGEHPENVSDWNPSQEDGVTTSWPNCANILNYIHLNDPAQDGHWQCINTPLDLTDPDYYFFYITRRMYANPKPTLFFEYCENITVTDLEIDGNISNMILGGETGIGHPCYEFFFHGIIIQNTMKVQLLNLNVHHMGTDGLGITNENVTTDNDVYVRNSKFNYNGRNGISWTAGRGITIDNCEANYNALLTLPIQTSPGAGLDMESEAAKVINGRIINSRFFGNKGHALGMPEYWDVPSYSGHHYFLGCEFGNSSSYGSSSVVYAALAQQRDVRFDSCKFYGYAIANFIPPVDEVATIENAPKFYDCFFSDCYNGNLVNMHSSTNRTAEIDSRKAIVDRCTFLTFDPLKAWDVVFGHDNMGNSPDDYIKVTSSKFIRYNTCNQVAGNLHNGGGVLWHCNLVDCRFYMHRLPGTNPSLPVFWDIQPTTQYYHEDNYLPSTCEISCANKNTPVITAEGPTTFCEGGHNSVTLSVTPYNNGHWNTGATAQTITVSTTGDYYFVADNICDNNGTTSNHIVVNVLPVPAIPTITADHPVINGVITVCTGDTVTLATDIIGVWNDPSHQTSTHLAVTTPGEYYITHTISNGCGSVTSTHIQVVFEQVPVLTANGPTIFCSGGSVTLSGNTNGGIWNVGGGTTPTLTVTETGDYYVTVANSCGTVQSNVIHVTVEPLPVTPVVTANAPTTFCNSGSVTLSGNINGGTWQPGGSISTTLIVTTPGEYYVVNTTQNCGSAESNHISVVVNPLPVVSAGSYTNITTASQPFQLTGTPSGGQFTGVGVTGNTFYPAIAGAGSFIISYMYTDNNGCSATASTVINVTACSFTVGAIEGQSNSCVFMDPSGYNGNVTYTVAANFASSYTWSISAAANAAIVSGQGTNTIIVHFNSAPIITQPSTAYVRVTVGNACGGASQTVTKYLVSAFPPSTAIGDISANPATSNPCMAINGQMSFSTVVNYQNVTYLQWSYPPTGATPVGLTNTDVLNLMIDPANLPQTSYVTVRAGNYCGLGSTTRSYTLTKQIPTQPNFSNSTSHICSGDAVFAVTQQSAAASYIWTHNESPVGSITSIIPTNPPATNSMLINFNNSFNSGSVSVAGANACGTSTTRTINISCDANKVIQLQKEKSGEKDRGNANAIYPNPSNGHFRIITTEKNTNSQIMISITDEAGKIVYKEYKKCTNGIIDVNLQGKLSSGLYNVFYLERNKQVIKKLIISK